MWVTQDVDGSVLVHSYESQDREDPQHRTFAVDISGDLALVATEDTAYDARVRPWFVLGRASETPRWTDPYILVPDNIPGDVADRLVLMGFEERTPAIDTMLGSPLQDELLEAASNLSNLRRHNENIQIATERSAKIVTALKTYAHPSAADARSEASLSKNLDTILTLFRGQLRMGVVEAGHDQLNQVWTNLISNALQAMGGRGSLEIRVRQSDSAVVVEVIDSGPGVSEEVQGRIFEPFVTSKASGEGVGIGLSISQDIVHAHGGEITVDSRPGRTRFSVRLPRRAKGGGGD